MVSTMKGEAEGHAKWGLMPPWNQVYYAGNILVAVNGTGLCFSDYLKIFSTNEAGLLHHVAF